MPEIISTDIVADSAFTLEVDGVSARLSVARMEGVEGISELFEWNLVVTTDDKLISFSDVVGRKATLTIKRGETRYVNGIVSRFKQGEEGNRLITFHVTIVPKLWRLQHRHDARIFQELTVPEIVKKVLDIAGLSSGDDYQFNDVKPGPIREYCVQYRESDFAFVSRLLEEEGIHYFFEHSADGHVLVMSQSISAAPPVVGDPAIVFRPPLGAMAQAGDSISAFTLSQEVRPGKVSLTDFNFKKPALSLMTTDAAAEDSDLEIYDYPGEYELPPEGRAYSKIRLEEWQSLKVVADGKSGVGRLTAGLQFSVIEHPRDEYNDSYVLTRVHHRGAQMQMGEAGGEGPSYSNTFQAVPSRVAFRPARKTPRPTVKGVQTAIVTGPAGEEVHTDEHGRVKVQFHWDRLGKRDDKSSCWIRVSQLWAGAGWGAMWIPRIGHEVIVDFVEGDPDRPIIVGRVYHGTNVPPYVLPAEKTKSTVRSNSSIGGNGENELMFEDKKGSEEIYLHAEKDWTIEVENDKTQHVGHDEKLTVDHDREKKVGHNQKEHVLNDKAITVGGNHTENIAKAEAISVGADASHTIGGAFVENVTKSKTQKVGSTLTETVGSNMTVTIGGAKQQSIGGELKESVAKDEDHAIGGKYQLTVKKGMNVDVGESQNTQVGKVQSANVGETYSLVVGAGKVTVQKNGDITIEGKQIRIEGTGPVYIKGSKLQIESDGSVDVKAGGAVKVKGSGIDMN